MGVYPSRAERLPKAVVRSWDSLGQIAFHQRKVVTGIRIIRIETQRTAVGQYSFSVFFQAIVRIA